MNILILGLNYAPEMVGIGPYTTGMAEFLAAAGHAVTVVCTKPYYPRWKVDPAFARDGRRVTMERGVRVVRVPTYVPANPDGKRRLAHHISFTAHAQFALIEETRRSKPDVVIGIAPSLISLLAARSAAHRARAKLWLHIQDFEVEAAFATGLLSPDGWLTRPAKAFETWSMRADRISTISPQMFKKLVDRGIPENRIVEFRNWANIDEVNPISQVSNFRSEWNISRPHVALYSGNIANKQGIEIVVEAARLLVHRRDLQFVICGNGPNREQLMTTAIGCDNITFQDLQPKERLPDLLGLASVHLLPQIAAAADLVLPSKLTNMLASGRPVVTTAYPGTGLALEVDGCGMVTKPGDADAFSVAITQLLDNDELRKTLGTRARARAEERWSRTRILKDFEKDLQILVADGNARPPTP